MKVTLDHTNLIDLEQDNRWAPYIRDLIALSHEGVINLRIVAISASEHRPTGKYRNFSEFQERINQVGLSDAEILKPIAYFDMAYFNYCVLGGGEVTKLETKIQNILFPNVERVYRDYCATLVALT